MIEEEEEEEFGEFEEFEDEPPISIKYIICLCCCYTWACLLPIPIIIILMKLNALNWVSGLIIGISCVIFCTVPKWCSKLYLRKINRDRKKTLELILGSEILDIEEEDILCTICLSNIKVGDTYTKLRCEHMYHRECIKTWLESKASCPICRERL